MYSGGIFDYEHKKDRLTEVEMELAEPKVWNDPSRAQELGRERSALEGVVATINELLEGVKDCHDLLELASEEDDQDTVDEIQKEASRLALRLEDLEFRRMFSGNMDENNACLLYTSPSPRDGATSRMPSSA